MKYFLSTLFLSAICLLNAVAQTTDCAKAVDIMCEGIDRVSTAIRDASSVEAVDTLDFDQIMGSENPEDQLEECGDYLLTSTDKEKLKMSCDGLIAAMVIVTYKDLGPGYSLDDIAEIMVPMNETLHGIVDNSETLKDFVLNWCMAFSDPD